MIILPGLIGNIDYTTNSFNRKENGVHVVRVLKARRYHPQLQLHKSKYGAGVFEKLNQAILEWVLIGKKGGELRGMHSQLANAMGIEDYDKNVMGK